MNTPFSQTTFETTLISKLVALLRKGRNGRKAMSFLRAKADKTLEQNGYTSMAAYHVWVNCSDVAELQIACEEAAA